MHSPFSNLGNMWRPRFEINKHTSRSVNRLVNKKTEVSGVFNLSL